MLCFNIHWHETFHSDGSCSFYSQVSWQLVYRQTCPSLLCGLFLHFFWFLAFAVILCIAVVHIGMLSHSIRARFWSGIETMTMSLLLISSLKMKVVCFEVLHEIQSAAIVITSVKRCAWSESDKNCFPFPRTWRWRPSDIAFQDHVLSFDL